MARTAPSNSDDIIDSRDIIERIKELEDDRDALETTHEELKEALEEVAGAQKTLDENVHGDLPEKALESALFDAEKAAIDAQGAVDLAEIVFDTDAQEELRVLLALQDEAEGYCPDWHHGASLIRYSYFKDYAQELADDIGAIPKDAGWPCTCIDWDEAAKELQQDYTSVAFDGIDYWIR